MKATTLATAMAALLASCGGASPPAAPPPPRPADVTPDAGVAAAPERSASLRTRKDDVVETLHGTRVADPYRWLEDGDSPEVKAWTDAENARTRAYLDGVPGRDALKAQIRTLLEVGYVTAPAVAETKHGRRYFHTKREGGQNQPVLYVRDGVAGKDRVLLDASSLSADGTTALDWWYPTEDGSKLAWGSSESGSEDSTLHVRDVETGKDLPDVIPFTRHASIAWMPNAKELYYSRYPEPGTVPPGDEKYGSKIFHHALGDDWKKDELVFDQMHDKVDVPQILASRSGRWLVVRVFKGWDKSDVYVRDRALGAKGKWVAVAEGIHANFDPTPLDDRLLLVTNDGAARYRVVQVDYAKPDKAHWKEIVPEAKDVLTGLAVAGDTLAATYLHDASTRIVLFAKDGKPKGDVALPSIGTASVSAPELGGELFVSFVSFVSPSQVLRHDLRGSAHGAVKTDPTAAGDVWDKVGASLPPEVTAGVEVKTLYATSKDGTKIPMFVVSKAGLPKDGKTPTVLWGYGGFNVNETPAFSTRALTVVQRGGVYVNAVLRGGGEFGEDWHHAGMLANKQNVFDDFIACAEELIAEKITSADKLAVIGGSNGGLLTAAVITQRPELFRAALSLVPLTDMLRYPRFRIARLWVPEYGDPEKAEDFKTLYAYSPYHHVKDGVRYPATLFTTAESDSRVDPMHARKMAARMQEAQGDPARPILLRVESKAGHGAGKPTSKLVEDLADQLTFLFHELGVSLGT